MLIRYELILKIHVLSLYHTHTRTQIPEDISEIMAKVLLTHNIPPVQQMRLLTRLRLAKNFGTLDHRVKCVLVRLQAISVLG